MPRVCKSRRSLLRKDYLGFLECLCLLYNHHMFLKSRHDLCLELNLLLRLQVVLLSSYLLG